MRSTMVAIGLALAVVPLGEASGGAQPSPADTPAVVGSVLQCRSITDPAARLACFDQTVAALGSARSKGELITLDRQEVRKARRSLFGLTLPNLPILGDDEGGKEGSEIETTIVRAAAMADGKWVFELAEGGRWAQTDSRPFVVDPKAGQTIRIRRAALGSYFANVNNQRAVRVKRLN